MEFKTCSIGCSMLWFI